MTREEYIRKINNDPTLIDAFCRKCGREFRCSPGHLGVCPVCVIELIPKNALTPECPTCHSKYIVRVSQTKRSLHAWAFGIANPTARAQFECKNCGYKW